MRASGASRLNRRRGSSVAAGTRSVNISPSAADKAAEEEKARRELEIRNEMELMSAGSAVSTHLERASPLPQTAYLRFRVAEDNRQLAELGRAERSALLILKEEQTSAWISQGHERYQERLLREKRSRKLRKQLIRRRGRTVRELREAEESDEKLIEERRHVFHDEMRKRVLAVRDSRAPRTRTLLLDTLLASALTCGMRVATAPVARAGVGA